MTTTYTVTVTDSKGCTKTDAVAVTVNPLPTVDAGADVIICLETSTTLSAVGSGGTPGYTYLWSNGANTATTSVSPAITTTYTVTVTDSKGCTATDQVKVTVEDRAKVGDYVWFDSNKDGIQDANETGINGVLVTLYNAATNTVVASTTTATNAGLDGYYQFNVCKGEYYIIFW